ncbi:hypothetical protein BGZ68_001314, partial [Mortierella alpina]
EAAVANIGEESDAAVTTNGTPAGLGAQSETGGAMDAVIPSDALGEQVPAIKEDTDMLHGDIQVDASAEPTVEQTAMAIDATVTEVPLSSEATDVVMEEQQDQQLQSHINPMQEEQQVQPQSTGEEPFGAVPSSTTQTSTPMEESVAPVTEAVTPMVESVVTSVLEPVEPTEAVVAPAVTPLNESEAALTEIVETATPTVDTVTPIVESYTPVLDSTSAVAESDFSASNPVVSATTLDSSVAGSFEQDQPIVGQSFVQQSFTNSTGDADHVTTTTSTTFTASSIDASGTTVTDITESDRTTVDYADGHQEQFPQEVHHQHVVAHAQPHQEQARIETLPDRAPAAHMIESSVAGVAETEPIVSEAATPVSAAMEMTPSSDSTSTPFPPVSAAAAEPAAAEVVTNPAVDDTHSDMDVARPAAVGGAESDQSTPAGLAGDMAVPSEAVAQEPETHTSQQESFLS